MSSRYGQKENKKMKSGGKIEVGEKKGKKKYVIGYASLCSSEHIASKRYLK